MVGLGSSWGRRQISEVADGYRWRRPEAEVGSGGSMSSAVFGGVGRRSF